MGGFEAARIGLAPETGSYVSVERPTSPSPISRPLDAALIPRIGSGNVQVP